MRLTRVRVIVGLTSVALVAALSGPIVATASASTSRPDPGRPSCRLGNGVKHVISLVFDNVHFFRDNPNVPSDLELMPHLKQFLETNGTILTNMHTG